MYDTIMVDTKDVVLHPIAQRVSTLKHVEDIANSFDPRLVDPLVAVEIKGQYQVIDGGHRLRVLERMGAAQVPVRIIGKNLSKDACLDLFYRLNRNKRPVSPIESYLLDLAAKDSDAVRLETLVSEHGFEIGNRGETLSAQAMREAQKAGVAEWLLHVFSALRANGSKKIYTASSIRAWTRFIKEVRTLRPDLDLVQFASGIDHDALSDDLGRGQVAPQLTEKLRNMVPPPGAPERKAA